MPWGLLGLELNVCGSTAGAEFIVRANEHLRRHTTPWLMRVSRRRGVVLPTLARTVSFPWAEQAAATRVVYTVVSPGMQVKKLFSTKWSTWAVKGPPVRRERRGDNGRDSSFPAPSLVKWFIHACRLHCIYFLNSGSLYQEEWAPLGAFSCCGCCCEEIRAPRSGQACQKFVVFSDVPFLRWCIWSAPDSGCWF